MLFISESQIEKLQGRPLECSRIYILSSELSLEDTDVVANKCIQLRPTVDLLNGLADGSISKKQFEKAYVEQLKSKKNDFILYNIVAAAASGSMPIFIISDKDYATDFTKVLIKYIKKQYGIKKIKASDYKKAVKNCWKEAKSAKKKKRGKTFNNALESMISNLVQLSGKGAERIEKLDAYYAIDKMEALFSQTPRDEMNEIGKQKLIRAINLFASYSKKRKKLVNELRKELQMAKLEKCDRWNRSDCIKLIERLYAETNKPDDVVDSKKK